jgi:putative membrane protein
VPSWPGIYLRGVLMGIAEIIPGVSGGTIAFITGIYAELLRTIAQLSPSALAVLWHDGPVEFWRQYNLTFLAVLGTGMLTSALLFANLMQYLLVAAPLLVWAFFFGLIAAACIDIGAQSQARSLATAGLAGLVLGVVLSLLGAGAPANGYPLLFIGAAIAVTAWILPGISGSYMLLLMGLYPTFVSAIADFDVAALLVIAAGLATGLLSFAKLLAFLLRRYYATMIALLTGFMAGSLTLLWPWRLPFDGLDGRPVHLPVDPWSFTAATGHEPAIAGVLASIAAGMVVVFVLSRFRPVSGPVQV